MANRYGVKKATLTYGAKQFDVVSMPVMKCATKEAIDVTALSDSVKQFVQGALKEEDEFKVTLYQKGTGDLTVDSEPASLSIAVTLENGESDVTANVSYSKAIVTKVEASSIDASSDRKAVYDVTFRPDGSSSASSYSE